MLLNNVCPFNECFYYNCFHTALFSIIRANGGNYLEFLVNGIPYLYKQENDKGIRILERLRFVEDYTNIIKQNGLIVEEFDDAREIGEFIKKSIENDAPVILGVDGWALPYREDLFHKIHWPHSILVVGLNKKSGELMVVDQSTRENMIFDFYYISIESVEKAVLLFSEQKKNNHLYTGYIGLSFYAIQRARYIEQKELQNKLKKNYELNQDLIMNGIDMAVGQKEEFLKCFSSVERIADIGEYVFGGFNDLVLQKKWQRKLMKEIFPVNSIEGQLSNKILNGWEKIRNYTGHIVLSGNVRKTTIGYFQETYSQLLIMEREYAKKIMEE